MKTLSFILLLFTFMGTKVFSQQCAYDKYYLFALQVKTMGSKLNVPNLKMYLVDEQDKPILTSVSYQEDQQWKHRYDTLFFWENEKMKKGPGNSPLFRQKFYNMGDYYLVAFRMEANQFKDPRAYPIYKLKIEGGSNALPNKNLPIQNAIRICGNGITSDFPLKNPVQSLDGKNFEPIEIVLDQAEPLEVVNNAEVGLKYTVRFDHETKYTAKKEVAGYVLNKARVYHTQTGKLHQEILIPRKTPSHDRENTYTVKFIDFYNRGITEAKDFSVQIESWRDEEIKGFRQKLNYYIFNPSTKLYELDTTLSNFNDVFFDDQLKVFKRYNFMVTPKSRTTFTFQLENKKWILIDSSEAFFEPPPPKIKYPSSNCMVVNGNEHILPLKAMNNSITQLGVVDTFWLYNNCEDTLFITKKESSTMEFFGTPQIFLPKQRTAIVFNGQLTNDTYNFHYHRFFCALTLTDGSIIGLSVIVPAVNKNVRVFYRADSTIQYAVSSLPQTRFSTAVFTFPSGQIRAFGTVLNKDTSWKVGNWNYFKEGSLNSEGLQYSKSITLSAFDEVNFNEHNKFKVNILDNGIWFEPIADYINNQVKFFITPQTDSIIAFTDSTSYAFAVSYEKIPLYFTKQFFLLKPNERTLKIGHYEMPFSTKKHQYALLLNYDRFKSKNRTTFQLTDSIISAIQSQYPKISTVRISSNQRGISLENLEQEEREKVLQQLIKDSSIAFICQLYYTNRNQEKLLYCDNKVRAEIEIDTDYPEKFKRTAMKLGYSNVDTDLGNNYFWLTYPSKLIDESFFESFNRLTHEKLVLGAYFNTYVEPELDNR
jgi:hypothetical protein